MINPANIIALLQRHFAKFKQITNATEIEKQLAKDFIGTIQRCLINNEEIETYDENIFDEDDFSFIKDQETVDYDDEDEDESIGDLTQHAPLQSSGKISIIIY
jgi:hypothetical protein